MSGAGQRRGIWPGLAWIGIVAAGVLVLLILHPVRSRLGSEFSRFDHVVPGSVGLAWAAGVATMVVLALVCWLRPVWLVWIGIVAAGALVLVALFPVEGDSRGDVAYFGNPVPGSGVLALAAGVATMVALALLRRRRSPSSRDEPGGNPAPPQPSPGG